LCELADFCSSCRLRFSFFQRGSLFQPSINHRASGYFCVFARSENCHLFRQPIAWKINSRAPLLSFDPFSDHVANASVFHELILDLTVGSTDVMPITNLNTIFDADHRNPLFCTQVSAITFFAQGWDYVPSKCIWGEVLCVPSRRGHAVSFVFARSC
jgi:hypothetical protein